MSRPGRCAATEGGIVAGERSGQREQSPPEGEQAQQERQKSPAYAFWVAAIALSVAALAFILTMFIFGGLFEDAATVIAGLGSLFTLIGTVVGAYFGIKVSNDTADRAQDAIKTASDRVQKANDLAREAYGKLDPQKLERGER
jgi:uncharacterized membrane protein YraQ (UPF0718 family)